MVERNDNAQLFHLAKNKNKLRKLVANLHWLERHYRRRSNKKHAIVISSIRSDTIVINVIKYQ